ncbi:MAG: hypothetical protein A3F74_17500 [Betaproteobacteria bacterium RIFCSPLOWO2_12_FULL_62_58]|nr:MAG: hypothetical protein A3F74_17500 [Betaproteobacteria bacterium RIFCSPLOWO2_12_FULL_62_58]
MTPATIIQKAQADGVTLILSPSGTIKAAGEREAVNRWLPIIREHKNEIVNELRAANNGAYDAPPDATAETRRQRVLAMLRENPTARYAIVTETESDPDAVIVTLAIRGRATCELQIPRDRYDGALLLDLIDRHSATVH